MKHHNNVIKQTTIKWRVKKEFSKLIFEGLIAMNYHFTVNGAIKEIKKHLKQENFNEASKICDALLQFDQPINLLKNPKRKLLIFQMKTHK